MLPDPQPVTYNLMLRKHGAGCVQRATLWRAQQVIGSARSWCCPLLAAENVCPAGLRYLYSCLLPAWEESVALCESPIGEGFAQRAERAAVLFVCFVVTHGHRQTGLPAACTAQLHRRRQHSWGKQVCTPDNPVDAAPAAGAACIQHQGCLDSQHITTARMQHHKQTKLLPVDTHKGRCFKLTRQ